MTSPSSPPPPRFSAAPTSPSHYSQSDGKGALFSPVSPEFSHGHASPHIKQEAVFDDGLIPYNAYAAQETNKELADHDTREARAPEAVAYPYYVEQPPAPEHSIQEPEPKKRRRKLLWIILGVVIAIIVIIAAVVGGVVGSRASRQDAAASGSSTSADGDGNSTSTNSTVAGAVALDAADRTGIATTSRPDGSGMLLYWQPFNTSSPTVMESFIANAALNGSTSDTNFVFSSQAEVPTPRLVAGSALSAISYTLNNVAYRQLFYVDDTNRVVTTRASGSDWSTPDNVSSSSDSFRAGSQGLTACVSTTGNLKGIRVFYGASSAIQQASWIFPEVKSQSWQKETTFSGTDELAGVTCDIFPGSNGNSLLNVYARSDTGGLAHFASEFASPNVGTRKIINETLLYASTADRVRDSSDISSVLDDTGRSLYIFYVATSGRMNMLTVDTSKVTTAMPANFYTLGMVNSRRVSDYYVSSGPMFVTQSTASRKLIASRLGTQKNRIQDGQLYIKGS